MRVTSPMSSHLFVTQRHDPHTWYGYCKVDGNPPPQRKARSRLGHREGRHLFRMVYSLHAATL